MNFIHNGIFRNLNPWAAMAPSTSETPLSLDRTVQAAVPVQEANHQENSSAHPQSLKSSTLTGSANSFRQDFPRIRAINDDAFKQLLLGVIDTEKEFTLHDCVISRRPEGAFKHCNPEAEQQGLLGD